MSIHSWYSKYSMDFMNNHSWYSKDSMDFMSIHSWYSRFYGFYEHSLLVFKNSMDFMSIHSWYSDEISMLDDWQTHRQNDVQNDILVGSFGKFPHSARRYGASCILFELKIFVYVFVNLFISYYLIRIILFILVIDEMTMKIVINGKM